jgi:hypothetical protein
MPALLSGLCLVPPFSFSLVLLLFCDAIVSDLSVNSMGANSTLASYGHCECVHIVPKRRNERQATNSGPQYDTAWSSFDFFDDNKGISECGRTFFPTPVQFASAQRWGSMVTKIVSDSVVCACPWQLQCFHTSSLNDIAGYLSIRHSAICLGLPFSCVTYLDLHFFDFRHFLHQQSAFSLIHVQDSSSAEDSPTYSLRGKA